MLDTIKNKLFPPVPSEEPAAPVDEVDAAPPAEDELPAPVPSEEPAAPVDEVDAAPPAEDELPAPVPSEEPAAPVDEVDALKKKLFAALVAADGRLATPEDIPYSPELLEGEALAAAIGKRLADNPRLGKNFAAGDVGAGNRGTPPRNTPDLMDMLKAAHSL